VEQWTPLADQRDNCDPVIEGVWAEADSFLDRYGETIQALARTTPTRTDDGRCAAPQAPAD
jgi:hypothetical protein